jgi:hypothetical protein
MTTYPHKEFIVADLRIGDVIKQFEGPWGTAIVSKIEPGQPGAVTFFRPYGATAGFRYGGIEPNGRTICYHGMEETTFLMDSKAKFFVYQREGSDV